MTQKKIFYLKTGFTPHLWTVTSQMLATTTQGSQIDVYWVHYDNFDTLSYLPQQTLLNRDLILP